MRLRIHTLTHVYLSVCLSVYLSVCVCVCVFRSRASVKGLVRLSYEARCYWRSVQHGWQRRSTPVSVLCPLQFLTGWFLVYCKNDDPHQYHCVQNKQTTVLSETNEESRSPTTLTTPCNASYASNVPVLEYGSPVWHYSITRAQSYQLESIKKRAVHITFSDTRGMSYPNVLFVANLNSLKDRRDRLSRSFFQNIFKPYSCLHHLLPSSHNSSIISRLRSSTSLPRPVSRTKKFQLFLNFAVDNYKNHLCNSLTQVFIFFLIIVIIQSTVLLLLSLSLFALISHCI